VYKNTELIISLCCTDQFCVRTRWFVCFQVGMRL